MSYFFSRGRYAAKVSSTAANRNCIDEMGSWNQTKYETAKFHTFKIQEKICSVITLKSIKYLTFHILDCKHCYGLISQIIFCFRDGAHASPSGSLKHTCPFSSTYLIAVGTLINPYAVCHHPCAGPKRWWVQTGGVSGAAVPAPLTFTSLDHNLPKIS